MADLHGKSPEVDEEYETPDDYSGQGDDRMIRVLSFLYTVEVETPDGMANVIEAREAKRNDVVTLEQIGLIAQQKGEKDHSFYTTDERELVEAGRNPDETSTATSGDVSDMGEFELSEYIKGANPTGKELTVNETVALAGTDKDLAHRLLQAENIATDGEPRKGVEAGLTTIIESG